MGWTTIKKRGCITKIWLDLTEAQMSVKCLTEQLQLPPHRQLPQWQNAASHSRTYGNYVLSTDKPPTTNPHRSSTDTCRRLSPTTGPLPTVHCWQSTMHCPDSAKWGKRSQIYVVHGEEPWVKTQYCPLNCDFIFGIHEKISLQHFSQFLNGSKLSIEGTKSRQFRK